MPDVYDPIAAQMSAAAAINQLNAFNTDLIGRTHLLLELYQNNVSPSAGNTLAAFTEATYSGYAAISAVTPLTGVSTGLNASNQAYQDAGLFAFACNGAGVSNTIYGATLVGTPTTSTQATATATESGGLYNSVTITNAGAGYTRAPKVTATGATGSGALLHSTLSATGTVATIVIDSPGSGYTTATLSIEEPLELIKQIVFPNPISMALATDLINTYLEIVEPAVAA